MNFDIRNEWQHDAGIATGGTLLAMEFVEGVIIASDSRTTDSSSGIDWDCMIHVVNRFTDELEKITDFIYCCRSGSAAVHQAFADMVSKTINLQEIVTGVPASVKGVAEEFRKVCYSNCNQGMAETIVAGYDTKKKKGEIHVITNTGMLLPAEKYSIYGSGSSYIYGFMERSYTANMLKDSAINLARKAIELAIARDVYSGGAIRVAIITKAKEPERLIFPETSIF